MLARRALLAAAISSPPLLGTSLWPLKVSAADEADGLSRLAGSGYEIRIPREYYTPKSSRPKTGLYDDTLVVAADYAAGRTATVTRTAAVDLLRDAGEPEALVGPLARLSELGKPLKVATLLAKRRDGDPTGQASQPRSAVLSAERVGDNELNFILSELTYTATSMTAAKPSARLVQARAVFVPATEARGACLYTAWASSYARGGLQCAPTSCEDQCAGKLSCDCPLPRCEATDAELELDALDAAIVRSLSVR